MRKKKRWAYTKELKTLRKWYKKQTILIFIENLLILVNKHSTYKLKFSNFTKKTHNWKSEKSLKKLLLGTRSLLLQEVTTPFKYTIALTVGTTKAVCSKLVAQRTERLFVRIATHLVSMTAKRNEHIIAKLMISNFDFEVELGKQITMIYGCRNTNITRPESTKMKENR